MAASAVALTGLQVQRPPPFSEGTPPLPIRRRGFKLPAALPVVACVSSWQKRRGRRRGKPRQQPQQSPAKGRGIDTEFDLVVVPTDGISMSGSESDNVSDWSVGWMEPHHANFLTDNELEDSFAVLVPCYGSPSPTSPTSPFAATEHQRLQPPWAAVLANLSKHPNQENKRHLENWLACL